MINAQHQVFQSSDGDAGDGGLAGHGRGGPPDGLEAAALKKVMEQLNASLSAVLGSRDNLLWGEAYLPLFRDLRTSYPGAISPGSIVLIEGDCSSDGQDMLQRPILNRGKLVIGQLDKAYTYSNARLNGQEIPSVSIDYQMFRDCLEPNSIERTAGLVTATSQFAISSNRFITLRGGSSRKEVHGIYTIPACFQIAKILLGDDISQADIVKLQISSPINTQLELVASEGKHKSKFDSDRKSLLFAHLKSGDRDIFIRGYATRKPVVAVIDSNAIPSHNVRNISVINRSSSHNQYSASISVINPKLQETIESDPALQAVLLLDAAQIVGATLLKRGLLGDVKGSYYVSRIRDFSFTSTAMLFDPNNSVLVDYFPDEAVRTKHAFIQPIRFQFKSGNDSAAGTIDLAWVQASSK